jgi:predicted  nucleic acid-binding Zn-ribbon protein
MRLALLLAAPLVIATIATAHADDTTEDRLRAALKQSVTEMRAAQDQASQAQAQLAQAQADLAALKTKFDADEAKIGQLSGNSAADKALKSEVDAAKEQNAALQSSLSKYEGAVQQAQDLARQKDAESQRAQAGLRSNFTALETCKTANKKLIDVAEQVLNLWHDRSFIWVLRKSYEPIVGADKVDLENIVQDYDDKIRDQEYIPPRETGRH